MAQTRAYLQFFAHISEEKQETVGKLLAEKFGIDVTHTPGGAPASFSLALCSIHGLERNQPDFAKDLFTRIGTSLLELSGVEIVHVKDWCGLYESVVSGELINEVHF